MLTPSWFMTAASKPAPATHCPGDGRQGVAAAPLPRLRAAWCFLPRAAVSLAVGAELKNAVCITGTIGRSSTSTSVICRTPRPRLLRTDHRPPAANPQLSRDIAQTCPDYHSPAMPRGSPASAGFRSSTTPAGELPAGHGVKGKRSVIFGGIGYGTMAKSGAGVSGRDCRGYRRSTSPTCRCPAARRRRSRSIFELPHHAYGDDLPPLPVVAKFRNRSAGCCCR
jgi:hypothetical protein